MLTRSGRVKHHSRSICGICNHLVAIHPLPPPTIFGKLLLPQDFLDGSSCKLFSSNDLPENYSYQMVYPWSSADSGILIPYYGM